MDINDIDTGSYSGRKFVLTIIGAGLITGFSVMTGFLPIFKDILPTFIGGILGVIGLYFGANVGNKFILGRIASRLTTTTTTTLGAQKTDPYAEEE